MPRTVTKKLDALFVKNALAGKKESKRYCDGDNLYLNVRGKAANWEHLYRGLDGKPHFHGLGPARIVTLEMARKLNMKALQLRREGVDPIEAKRAGAAKQKLEAAKAISFQDCADKYIKSHRAGWRSEKHAKQWESTIRDHAGPIIGGMAVGDIDTQDIMKVLHQLWMAKPETANRVRGRIENILDWAGPRLPRRREPGALARPSRQASARARQGCEDSAS